jgi:hypothetical protein
MQLYDKLWKGVIEDFFVDFLYFFTRKPTLFLIYQKVMSF